MEAKPGTYILILKNLSQAEIKIGRWGDLSIDPGYYTYVGSAFGPGGVRARVLRHWRESKSMHWHIDYLREHITPVCVWYCYGSRDIEHKWAQTFSSMDDTLPIKRFGCSDCQCFTHLFKLSESPRLEEFSTILGQQIESAEYVPVC